MAGGLLVGRVWHRRLRPVVHAFRYPLFLLALPVDRLAACASVLAINRAGVVSFHERDHGARDGTPLADWFRCEVGPHLGLDPFAEGRTVTLYAQPRLFGYVFNPVSFWVCRRADGVVYAVLAEVNNTFGQRHAYLLGGAQATLNDCAEVTIAKRLHVSPFNQVRGGYRFRFVLGAPARGFVVRIDYDDGDGVLLQTALTGREVPLTRRRLLGLVARYPLQSFLVTIRIHAHALRLWWKRVPFYGKLASKDIGLSRS
ncbi:MAG: DUF1365 domain-containing protein [Casimicrobiaceae bacterium]|nr:DUF1365 domain-containing protein [Casimicrobiaceae bacterium]MCX8099554.1 DUF1365 domain-containing protein [Casimicrobiaceae bacterium]